MSLRAIEGKSEVLKEGATWKVRRDRSAKEGWGRMEAMRKIREG